MRREKGGGGGKGEGEGGGGGGVGGRKGRAHRVGQGMEGAGEGTIGHCTFKHCLNFRSGGTRPRWVHLVTGATRVAGDTRVIRDTGVLGLLVLGNNGVLRVLRMVGLVELWKSKNPEKRCSLGKGDSKGQVGQSTPHGTHGYPYSPGKKNKR